MSAGGRRWEWLLTVWLIIYAGVAIILLQGSVIKLTILLEIPANCPLNIPQQRISHPGPRHSQPPRPLLLHRSGEPRPRNDIFLSEDWRGILLLSLENWCWCCPISLAVAGCESQFVCICRAIEVINNKSIKWNVHLSDPSAQGFSASQRFFSCRKSFKYNISLRFVTRFPRRKSSFKFSQPWKSDSDSIPFRLRQNLEKK